MLKISKNNVKNKNITILCLFLLKNRLNLNTMTRYDASKQNSQKPRKVSNNSYSWRRNTGIRTVFQKLKRHLLSINPE